MNTRLFFMIMLLCILTSGCSGSLRSRDDHTYVIVRVGDPVQILDNEDGKGTPVKVIGKSMKTGETAKQEITGWIAMPMDHWEIIKKDLLKLHPEAEVPPKP